MMYNGFKIGVFFKNKKWAEQWFKDFIDKIDHSCILRFVKNGIYPFMIEMKDGTTIVAYHINYNLRGYNIDKAFIEPSIDEVMINDIIKPMCIGQRIIIDYK